MSKINRAHNFLDEGELEVLQKKAALEDPVRKANLLDLILL